MTKNETGSILAKLTSAYPSYFAKLDEKRKKDLFDTWLEIFAHDSYEVVNSAVNQLIKTSTFMPSIAEIRKLMPKDVNGSTTEPTDYALTPTQEKWASSLYGELTGYQRKEFWHFFNDPIRAEFVKGARV